MFVSVCESFFNSIHKRGYATLCLFSYYESIVVVIISYYNMTLLHANQSNSQQNNPFTFRIFCVGSNLWFSNEAWSQNHFVLRDFLSNVTLQIWNTHLYQTNWLILTQNLRLNLSISIYYKELWATKYVFIVFIYISWIEISWYQSVQNDLISISTLFNFISFVASRIVCMATSIFISPLLASVY